MIASAVQIGSGGDQVTISAIVKGAGNVALCRCASELFYHRSVTPTFGLIRLLTTTGVATATLAAGANKSNRNINRYRPIRVGAIGHDRDPLVVGTVLTYAGVTTVTLGSTASVGCQGRQTRGGP